MGDKHESHNDHSRDADRLANSNGDPDALSNLSGSGDSIPVVRCTDVGWDSCSGHFLGNELW